MLDFEELAERDLGVVDSEDEEGLGGTPWLRRRPARAPGDGPAAGARQGRKPERWPMPRELISRRMQVLVLHGRQSNESLVSFQLSGLKQALGKEVDIKYLEGDLVWRYREGVDNHDADPMALQLAKGKDFKTWFAHTTDDSRDRVDFFKQQDPHVKVTYHDVDKAVSRLLKYVEEEGPVDAVVSIFEGTIVVHLAIARQLQESKPIPWRLSVFFGPMCVRDDDLSEALTTCKVPHPTVHVFGKGDEYCFYQRTAAGRRPPEEYYEDPVILEHQEGHQLPSPGNPRSKEIYDRVVAEMLYQSGSSKTAPRKVRNPQRPPSMPLRNYEDMTPRKLRVLCMCGGHSCTAVIKFQTAQLKAALGKDASEWTYIEGTKDWEWYEGEPTVSEMEKTIAKGAQLKNWYMDKCHEAGGTKTDRLNKDKQFDPETRVEYETVPEVVDSLKSYIMAEGPFDVIVAFSQGCIMTHLLVGHWRKEPPAGREKHAERWKHARHSSEQMPWRCTVFFNGMHIRDADYFHLFDTKSPHPTVHVFGKDDEYYDYARDGFGNKPQEEYYVDPVVLTHEQSHEFPTVQPRAKDIYDKVSAEIWRHCGGKPVA